MDTSAITLEPSMLILFKVIEYDSKTADSPISI